MVRSNVPRIFWIVLCALGTASAAHARSETIRWSQSQPGLIASFQIRWGEASGSYPNVVEVGLPVPDSSGVYSHTLEVPEGAVYVVARSRDLAGYYSTFSNEKVLSSSSQPPPPPPPDPGDGWSADFEGVSIGSVVPGWLDTGAKNSLVQDDSLFGVMDVGGNRVFGTSSGKLNIHSHTGAAVGWSNYELSGRMRVENASGSVGVTAYSAYPSEDVYYKLFRIGDQPDAAFWIVGHPDIACDSEHTGVTPVAGAWYRFRFEVSSNSTANRIRARVWRQGNAEPSFWQATCLDDSPGRPTSGTVGVWSRGSGEKYWDDLAIVPVPALEEGAGGGGSEEEELGAPGRPTVIGP